MLEGVAREEIEALYGSLVNVAKDPKFLQRIIQAGYRPDVVPQLLERLHRYFIEDGIKIAKGWVSWTDGGLLALTRSAGKNWNKMAHELTHVLEYISNPSILEKEALGWWDVMGAEYRAFLVQTGSRTMGGGGSFLTPFANTFDYAGVSLPLRELLYWEASGLGLTG